MSSTLRLAIQTSMLPGEALDEKFHHAAAHGFDGVELNIPADADLGAIVRAADAASRQHGVPVSSFCTTGQHDPLQPDAGERARRFAVLTELIEAADALGAAGVVSVPLRPALGAYDRGDAASGIAALTDDAVAAFGGWAASVPSGTAAVFLEPLNRYEARFLRRVEQAAEIARRIDSPRVRALGDTYHMNIEEADPGAALREAGALLGHIHAADNTRFLPGAGCLDFQRIFGALREIGYAGWVALECAVPPGQVLMTDPATELPATVAFLRDQWERAGRQG